MIKGFKQILLRLLNNLCNFKKFKKLMIKKIQKQKEVQQGGNKKKKCSVNWVGGRIFSLFYKTRKQLIKQ